MLASNSISNDGDDRKRYDKSSSQPKNVFVYFKNDNVNDFVRKSVVAAYMRFYGLLLTFL